MTEIAEIRAVDSIFNMASTKTINHESIATLYSCVRLISNTISATAIKHLNAKQEEIPDSPTTKTLASPREFSTYFSWMNSMARDLLLHGNSYSIIADKELIYVPQDAVKIYITNQIQNPFYYQITINGVPKDFFPEAIVHFKNISSDGYLGISPLTLHKSTFDASATMVEYASKFVENSASLGGIITTDKKLNREAIDEIKNAFSNKFAGAENAGKIPVLANGMGFQEIKRASPTDIDFINNYKLNKSLIAEIFQVPLSMLGTADLAYNNAESNALMFQNFTIAPILRNIEQELTLKLLPKESKDKLSFLVDSLQLASTKEKADSLSLLVNTKIFTPNEARKKYGLTAMPGGDEFQVDINKVGDSQEAPKNTTDTNPPANKDTPPSKRSK